MMKDEYGMRNGKSPPENILPMFSGGCRSFLHHSSSLVVLLCVLAAAGRATWLGADEIPATAGVLDSRVARAAERGLEWLARTQNENGSWTCRVGYKLNERYEWEGEYDNVGITPIAGMAFLAGGHVPGRGKYGDNVQRAVDFVTSCQRSEDGYITRHGTRMYEHAFATLFLAEAYGMIRDERVGDALRKATALISRSQNPEGGWRYQPHPRDADLSVTVSTLQALRAARNVGISVPKEVIDRAVKYVKACARSRDGSFSYQALEPYRTRTSFALTACGVVSLYSAGEYLSREVKNGITYLETHMGELGKGMYHYYYGHYYAAQAMYLAGGNHWENYSSRIQDEILDQQLSDGHWEDDVGPPYATAMACVILQIPCEYLPLFQR